MKRYEDLDITDNFMFAKVFSNEDVAKDDNPGSARYFDVEMQMENTGELPKRARYYQSMCDLDALGKGVDYDELREQYILFICPTDIFGKGKAIYRFENREESDPNILMGDLTYKNYYIFKKYGEIEDESTREYMQYFATRKHESEKMKRIQELVEKYRRDPITRKAYMTLEQELNIRYKKGAKDKTKELAKGFRDDGFPLEAIAKRTGLTKEEILAL